MEKTLRRDMHWYFAYVLMGISRVNQVYLVGKFDCSFVLILQLFKRREEQVCVLDIPKLLALLLPLVDERNPVGLIG